MAVDPELVELRELVKKLETRTADLEKIIRSDGHRKILDFGTSRVVVTQTEFKIETTGDFSVRASGRIQLKASKILTN
jgi:hypothetical protein